MVPRHVSKMALIHRRREQFREQDARAKDSKLLIVLSDSMVDPSYALCVRSPDTVPRSRRLRRLKPDPMCKANRNLTTGTRCPRHSVL